MARPPSLDELFLAHVGPSLAKHLTLLAAVQGLPCDIDLGRGEARFGGRYTFAVQLLGTAGGERGTWTWGWNLPEADVPRPLVETALQLRAFGESRRLPLFTAPRPDMAPWNADQVAILCCGLTGSDGFLVADTDLMGATYFLIPDLAGQLPRRHAAAFLAQTVLPQLLETFEIAGHRQLLRALLVWEGFAIHQEDPRTWRASRPGGSRLTATFDPQGRITRLTAHDEA
jgi:hypothetical protein